VFARQLQSTLGNFVFSSHRNCDPFLSQSGKKMPRRPTPTDWLAPFFGLQSPQSDRVVKASERLVARPAKAGPVKKGQTSKKGALLVFKER
jgi:hypothetical protein